MANYFILGAGISGIAAARYAAMLGHKVHVYNDTPLDSQTESQLANVHISFIQQSDSNPKTLLDKIDVVVPSPGILESHPLLTEARSRGLKFISEIELALSGIKGRIIGVTGTNGKSTTTAMTAHILNRMGYHAVACGNIGTAPCALLADGANFDYWVIELSSYQISIAESIPCDAIIFTSFSPDHLARHGTVENYFAAKLSLINAAKSNAPLILSQEADTAIRQMNLPIIADVNQFVIDENKLTKHAPAFIPTKHDQINSLLSAWCINALVPDYSISVLIEQLRDFTALPYRYNHVANTVAHKPIINDSKSTNVDACIRALENQDEPIILLLGGRGKGESFTPIAKFQKIIKEVWCFGEASPEIYTELTSAGLKCKKFPSLRDCLNFLKAQFESISSPVVFSPACASFDEFKNFEDRGKFFNQEVLSYAKPARNSTLHSD